jgi:hypothetical protein
VKRDSAAGLARHEAALSGEPIEFEGIRKRLLPERGAHPGGGISTAIRSPRSDTTIHVDEFAADRAFAIPG